MRRGRTKRIAAALAAAGIWALPVAGWQATPASATESQAEKCQKEEKREEESVSLTAEFLATPAIEAGMQPASGGEVAHGQPATFSAEGSTKLVLSFYVASSESSLYKTSIASGPGHPEANGETLRYNFTSSKAAATLGTFYWGVAYPLQAEFTLKECEGKHLTYERTFYTKARAYQVVPASEVPEKPPSEETPTGSSPGSGGKSTWSGGTSLQVGITAKRSLRLRRNALAYTVGCTAGCRGTTAWTAWLLKPHAKPSLLKILGYGPTGFAINGSKGGHLLFSHRFKGRALKRLRSLLRGSARIRVDVEASASAGSEHAVAVHAKRSILLRP